MPSITSSRKPDWTTHQLAIFLRRTKTAAFIIVGLRFFPHYFMAPGYAIVAGETTPEIEARFGLVRA